MCLCDFLKYIFIYKFIYIIYIHESVKDPNLILNFLFSKPSEFLGIRVTRKNLIYQI